MTVVLLRGYIHSWTYFSDDFLAWQAFAGASEGGGTPPMWTQAADPKTAAPPADAAGSLWRFGETDEVPPTIAEIAAEMSRRYLSEEPATPLAAYFSCGGRGVFLLDCCGAYYVVVARGSPTPRIGASEDSMCRRAGITLSEVVLCESTCES